MEDIEDILTISIDKENKQILIGSAVKLSVLMDILAAYDSDNFDDYTIMPIELYDEEDSDGSEGDVEYVCDYDESRTDSTWCDGIGSFAFKTQDTSY